MNRPMTITEKVIANAAGKGEVVPGEIVNAKIDLVYTMDFLGKVVFGHLNRIGAKRVFDKEKVVVIFDHLTPPASKNAAEIQKFVRNAVKEMGGKLYDVGRHGIMHQVIVEKGFVRPGDLVVGTDSHTPTAGALGAVVIGVGATDAAVAMATGELWVRVPEQVKVNVKGDFMPGVTSRDLVFYLIKAKGWDGTTGEWAYKSIEFAGETIKKLSIDSRLTATNYISDMGAKNAIIEPDQTTIDFLESKGCKELRVLKSDEGAEYCEILEVEVGNLPPLVACPDSPDNVKKVEDIAGARIDQAVIGSCANGRLEDLRMAASILKGRKVNDGSRLIISPASQEVFLKAIEEGLIRTFLEAGALVAEPSCGPCYGGHLGLLADNEVCISTTTRNMKGRMGSDEAEIYLANPAVVAASAVKGCIADPREFLD